MWPLSNTLKLAYGSLFSVLLDISYADFLDDAYPSIVALVVHNPSIFFSFAFPVELAEYLRVSENLIELCVTKEEKDAKSAFAIYKSPLSLFALLLPGIYNILHVENDDEIYSAVKLLRY
jgi:hypothetical protein